MFSAFACAAIPRDGNALRLFFELRAGGYGGSTHTLNYDAASDTLRGVYDQVVVKQKFDVVFKRLSDGGIPRSPWSVRERTAEQTGEKSASLPSMYKVIVGSP